MYTRDLYNQKFGRLTAISLVDGTGKRKWLCQCECGKSVIVLQGNLTRSHTLSCGCLKQEIVRSGAHTVHGQSHTRLYSIWKGMRKRCYNQNASNYPRYGGRGITICSEWLESFEHFHAWAMQNGYADDLSIDRMDVNGNYSPENCRFATAKRQSNNRRSNRVIVCNGISKTVAEWSVTTGVSAMSITARIDRLGWDTEKALYTKSK